MPGDLAVQSDRARTSEVYGGREDARSSSPVEGREDPGRQQSSWACGLEVLLGYAEIDHERGFTLGFSYCTLKNLLKVDQNWFTVYLK